MNRRNFLSSIAATVTGTAFATPLFGTRSEASKLSHKERVDRALRGQELDRPPFTFYHHYKRPTAQQEATDHLDFHRAYKTDIVKVMIDLDYPQSTTDKWYELKPLDSPYPNQLATLKYVREGLVIEGEGRTIQLLAAEPIHSRFRLSLPRSPFIVFSATYR